MKKKIVFGYWFYNIFPIVFIGVWVFAIILISNYDVPLWVYIIFIVEIAFFSIVGSVYYFQFTVFSDKGIKTRTILRTIRELKWDEVKEVRYERLYVSQPGAFTTGWYLFDDGVERKQLNGLGSKHTHITVKASKRTRKIIEQFWHGEIIEK